MALLAVAVAVAVACHAVSPPATTPSPQATAPAALVANVAPVDAQDSSGWTALQRAAESGDIAEIDRLLAAGANLEASSPTVYQGATALVIALEFNQHAAAKHLLERGASISGATGRAALVLAAATGDIEVLDAVLAHGTSPRGTNALHAAARAGEVVAIARLLRAGAAVNDPWRDDHGYTPLLYACMEGKVDAARALLAAGAHADDVDADGTNALHWAVFAARPEEWHIYRKLGGPHDTVFKPRHSAPVVELLIAHGAKLEAADAEGNTALHEAALMDAKVAAQLLVRAGASRAARNQDGKTPYDLAHDRQNSVEAVLKP